MPVLHQLLVEHRPHNFNGRPVPYPRLERVCCHTPMAVEVVQRYAVDYYAGQAGPHARRCPHPPAYVDSRPAVLITVKHADDVNAGASQKQASMRTQQKQDGPVRVLARKLVAVGVGQDEVVAEHGQVRVVGQHGRVVCAEGVDNRAHVCMKVGGPVGLRGRWGLRRGRGCRGRRRGHVARISVIELVEVTWGGVVTMLPQSSFSVETVGGYTGARGCGTPPDIDVQRRHDGGRARASRTAKGKSRALQRLRAGQVGGECGGAHRDGDAGDGNTFRSS